MDAFHCSEGLGGLWKTVYLGEAIDCFERKGETARCHLQELVWNSRRSVGLEGVEGQQRNSTIVQGTFKTSMSHFPSRRRVRYVALSVLEEMHLRRKVMYSQAEFYLPLETPKRML